MQITETPTDAPQKTLRPDHPLRRIAPAIGLPTSKPNAIGTKSIPIRTPMTCGWGERVTDTVEGRDTKLPEKNLDLGSATGLLGRRSPSSGALPIEDTESNDAGFALNANPYEGKESSNETAWNEHIQRANVVGYVVG